MLEANALDFNHRYAVYVLPVWRLLSASTVTSLSAATDPVARGYSRLDSGDIKDVSGGGSNKFGKIQRCRGSAALRSIGPARLAGR